MCGRRAGGLTCVDEASRRPLTELFGLVGQRDLDDPGDVAGRSLDPDGVGGDQLTQTSIHESEGVSHTGY